MRRVVIIFILVVLAAVVAAEAIAKYHDKTGCWDPLTPHKDKNVCQEKP